ncbi:MAG TPA: homoserine dehydrogenase [Planctomycetaceae bacterium]|nr:homoserine dehydrogenase [Planctomycetaceae bacterium]HQZ68862.1 homoserine dehydrogenase [Planctomycetaceae bacterium]
MSQISDMNIALVGCGTVGSGVVRILQTSTESIRQRTGRSIQLRHVVVQNPGKPRNVDLSGIAVSDDIQSVLSDPQIQVVIHVVGGISPAREDVIRLLNSGKDVITANKALLYAHGEELFALAGKLNRTICFEAAVAGGIPIISAVNTALTANRIISIEAILNGTSNFILTRMLDLRQTYDDVLKEAQTRGYAEADPMMDVDGTDAAQKLSILTWLAWGTWVRLEDIVRQGIQQIELLDLLVAQELGYRVKLLAISHLANGRLEVSVQPTLVRSGRAVAMTNGADNIVSIEGDAVGLVRISGAGAGQMPTASAVIADLIDYATGRAAITFQSILRQQAMPPVSLQPQEELSRRYYLRFTVADRPHVLADIADILGRHEISISSVRQDETEDIDDESGVARLVIMTHRTTEGRLRNADTEIAALSSIRGDRIRMPIAD